MNTMTITPLPRTTQPSASGKRRSADEGNISVFTLGWLALALMALLVMAAASQVHVDRTRLASLADETALAAADQVDEGLYFDSDGSETTLSKAAMTAVVSRWLEHDPRPWVAEVTVLDVSGKADGTATVRLGRMVYPLFDVEALGPFHAGISLEVEGSARAG